MSKFLVIPKGGGTARYSGCPTFTGTYMKPGMVEFREIASPTPIDWSVGDYIGYQSGSSVVAGYSRTGLRYTLYSLPQVKKQARSTEYGGAFVYQNVQFFDDSKQLEICPFRDLVPDDNLIHFSTQPSISTFEGVDGIARRIQACLDDMYPNTWVVRLATTEMGASQDLVDLMAEARDFTVSGVSLLGALDKIYEVWPEVGWVFSYDSVTGKNVLTIGGAGLNQAQSYQYGKGNGLKSITRTVANADEIATRIFAYGSSRNMLPRWYNKQNIKSAESVDIQNLMLPVDAVPSMNYGGWGKTLEDGSLKPDAAKAFLDASAAIMTRLGLRPKTYYFDGTGDLPEIYPTIREMTIKDVRDSKSSSSDPYYPKATVYTDETARVDTILSAPSSFDSGLPGETSGVANLETETLPINASNTFTQLAGLTYYPFYHYQGEWTPGRAGTVALSLSLDLGGSVQLDGIESVTVSVRIKHPSYQGNTVFGREYELRRDGVNSVSLSGIEFETDKIRVDNVTYDVYVDLAVSNAAQQTDKTGTFSVNGGFAFTLENSRTKTFKVGIRQIGFNINEQANLGEGKTIAMRSGKCAGRSFVIKSCAYVESTDSWSLEVIRSNDESLSQWFPNSSYPIAVDDEFVLLDIAMPDEYILVAEKRLLAAAQELLADVSVERWQYIPDIDAKFMVENNRSILPAQNMQLVDANVVENGSVAILIDTVTINEGEAAIPTYKVTLRDRKKKTFTEAKGTDSMSSNPVTNSTNNASSNMSTQESYFTLDAAGNVTLKEAYKNLWVPGWLAAGGVGEDDNGGGGGGGLIENVWGKNDLGGKYTGNPADDNPTETFSAYAIDYIYQAVAAIQQTTPNVSLSNGSSYSSLSVNGTSADFYTKGQVDSLISSDLSGYVQKVTSTDNAIVRFNGTGGAVQNSGVKIDDSNNLILPSGSSNTFASNPKIRIGNAWLGTNTSGSLAYGSVSGSTYSAYYTLEPTQFRPASGQSNKIDIGTSSLLFKDIYLAGQIKNASYSLTIPSKNGTIAVTSDIPAYALGTALSATAARGTMLGVSAISYDLSSTGSESSLIVWDSSRSAWHFLGNIYADGWIAAGGIGSGGSGGGGLIETVYGEADLGSIYSVGGTEDLTKTFSAFAIDKVWQRVQDTYTIAQVNALLDSVNSFEYVVANSLPTAGVSTMYKIYLIPSSNPQTQNVKDEFITIYDGSNYVWEQFGTTSVDLSNYVTNTALGNWTGSANITTVGSITSGTWGGTAIGVTKGGTGLTSITKGQILYASANNTIAKLNANGTTTKKFLSQTSNNAPAWSTIGESDIPDLYVKLSGNQTVGGNKTFTGTLFGASSSNPSWEIDNDGTATFYELYIKSGGGIFPLADDMDAIGSSSYRFSEGYINIIYADEIHGPTNGWWIADDNTAGGFGEISTQNLFVDNIFPYTENGTISLNSTVYVDDNLTVEGGSYIQIGDAYIAWDDTAKALRVYGTTTSGNVTSNIGFYCDGWVAAGGVGSGSNGAVQYLSDLEDVQNGTPSNNDMLVYDTSVNGGTWTYVAKSSIVPSAVPLSNITGADDLKAIEALTGTSGFLKKTAANTWTLDTNTYLTSSDLSGYLPLTGGTLTGKLTITPSTNTATTSNGLDFGTTSDISAHIASTTSGALLGIYAKGNIYIRPGDGTAISSSYGIQLTPTDFKYNGNNVYHAGNLLPMRRYTYSVQGTRSYYWVKIANTDTWSGSFTVKIYSNYHHETYEIGGYNYQTGWYSPKARLLMSTYRASVDVIFGYDGANELWFIIPTTENSTSKIHAIEIFGFNGNRASGKYLNEDTDFSCTIISSLDSVTGTTQTTTTVNNVLTGSTGVRLDTDQVITGTKTFSSGLVVIKTGTGGTPTLLLQRGTDSDNYVDWKIQSNAGALNFIYSSGGTDTGKIAMTSTTLRPHADTVTDTISTLTLGTESQQWGGLYSTTGTFSSSVTTPSLTTTNLTTGDLIIKTATTGTPTLTFLRGTASDNSADWKLISDSGHFYIARGQNGTQTNLLDLYTTGITPVGTVTNGVSSLSLGSSTNFWNEVYATKYYIGYTNAYLMAGSAGNVYITNSSGAVFVCDGKVIRRSTSSSMADVTLGSATYPWGGVFSTTGNFTGAVTMADLTIATATSGTPTILLQRGTASDGYVDWKLANDGGDFHLIRSKSGTDTLFYKFSEVAFSPRGTVTDSVSNLSLGGSSYRWATVYGAAGDFSTTLTVGGDTTLGGNLSVPTSKYIKVGDAYLEYDSTNHALRVYGTYTSGNDTLNIGLYCDGWIAAGGIGSQSNSSIAYLSDLEDVENGTPDNGDLLVYNSTDSEWKYTPQSALVPTLSVVVPSTGNALTGVTVSGGTFTFTTGTFLTSSDLDEYVNEIATGSGNYINGVSKSGKKLTFTYGTLPTTIALSNVTGADDLKAIEALTGTSGLLKKTAANTWALDTNAYALQAGASTYNFEVASLILPNGTLSAYTGSGFLSERIKFSYTDNTTNPPSLEEKILAYTDDIPDLSAWMGSTNLTTVGTITTGTWNGTKIGVTKGGTGLDSIAIYSLLYASAANTLSALAPNKTSTKKFLRMTGTGSAGATPAWDTIAESDIPDSYVKLTGTQTVGGAKTFSDNATFSGNISVAGTVSVASKTMIDLTQSGMMMLGYGARAERSFNCYGNTFNLRVCDANGDQVNILSVQPTVITANSKIIPNYTTGIDLGGSSSNQRWSTIYGVNANLSSSITLSGTNDSDRRIFFGDSNHYIELKNIGTSQSPVYAFHFTDGVYSDSWVAAGGVGSGSDGGNYELTSNKVTSLSSASTDTQYPSAKCVYDIVGDVETLLAAL